MFSELKYFVQLFTSVASRLVVYLRFQLSSGGRFCDYNRHDLLRNSIYDIWMLYASILGERFFPFLNLCLPLSQKRR